MLDGYLLRVARMRQAVFTCRYGLWHLVHRCLDTGTAARFSVEPQLEKIKAATAEPSVITLMNPWTSITAVCPLP